MSVILESIAEALIYLASEAKKEGYPKLSNMLNVISMDIDVWENEQSKGKISHQELEEIVREHFVSGIVMIRKELMPKHILDEWQRTINQQFRIHSMIDSAEKKALSNKVSTECMLIQDRISRYH